MPDSSTLSTFKERPTRRHTTYDTKRQADLADNPEDAISVRLTIDLPNDPFEAGDDSTKYMVVAEDQLFVNFHVANHSFTGKTLRSSLAAELIHNQIVGHTNNGTSPKYVLKLLGFSEMLDLGISGALASEIVASQSNHAPRLRVGIYRDFTSPNGQEYIISYAGTNDLKDLIDNVFQGSGFMTAQYEFAGRLGVHLKTEVVPFHEKHTDKTFRIAGHSLGGGLASLRASLPTCRHTRSTQQGSIALY